MLKALQGVLDRHIKVFENDLVRACKGQQRAAFFDKLDNRLDPFVADAAGVGLHYALLGDTVDQGPRLHALRDNQHVKVGAEVPFANTGIIYALKRKAVVLQRQSCPTLVH